MANPEHVQGSPEWLEMRRGHLGASDAAAILGVSPWTTAYDCWLDKMGLAPPLIVSVPMQRGIDMEPVARRAFEDEVLMKVPPAVLFHPKIPFMMASMDGWNEIIGVEIKCPGKKSHDIALSGKVPDCYIPQVQHQLAVCGLDVLYYWSFDGKEGKLVEVYRDDEYIANLLREEKIFWEEYVMKGVPPPLVDSDFRSVEDQATIWLIDELHEIEDSLIPYLALCKRKETIKEDLAKRLDGNSRYGDFRATKVVRRGNVNYKAIPELIGVDLEVHRVKSTTYYKMRFA